MIIDPAKILRGVAANLRAGAPVVSVGSIFDQAVMRIVEDGADWRDLTATRSAREDRYRA